MRFRAARWPVLRPRDFRSMNRQIDVRKSSALRSNRWSSHADRQMGWPGGNGLMAGFNRAGGRSIQHGIADAATYLLPVLRYRPGIRKRHWKISAEYGCEHAAVLFRLHSARKPESTRSHLCVPYERLTKKLKDIRPMLPAITKPPLHLWRSLCSDLGRAGEGHRGSFILQMNLSRTDFLCAKAYPSYLYYNPWSNEAGDAGAGRWGLDLYDLSAHVYRRAKERRVALTIPAKVQK